MDQPSWTPSPDERADLELLLAGGYPPLTGFMGSADVASVRAGGRLADGTPWPVPVILEVPPDVAASVVRGRVTLTDPEGAPVATMDVTEIWDAADGRQFVAGPVRPLAPPAYGAFRRLHLTAAEVREHLGGAPALAVITGGPLHCREIAAVRAGAEALPADARILLLVPTAAPGSEALIRLVLAAAGDLPRSMVVAVPLPRPDGSVAERQRVAHVAAAYGATQVFAAADPPALPDGELGALLDAGAPLPAGFTPPAVERELRRARRTLTQRGLVVLFTGLSGSGKSTLARGLHDAVAERGDRTVTLLDGDVVRRMLSAGLSFSRADRDLNVARIGFVAAEVGRHGGIAICAPIAPYARTRAEVRAMAEAVGSFVLVWVATPLARCEERDRKGLYARARAGQLTGFTGIDDPYEEPSDADLVIDTSTRGVDDCVREVVELLQRGGWLAAEPGPTP